MAQAQPFFIESNPESPVAICTLGSHGLLQEIASSKILDDVAIVGPLETPNIGIERMLLSLLGRPRIRWLIVCGKERRGAYQGQALVSLFAHGIDADGWIVGARSKRARLASITGAQAAAGCRQVQLVDLQGTTDLDLIAAEVARCRADNPGPFDEPVDLPAAPDLEVERRPFRLDATDPAGFFVIYVDRPRQGLLIEHYGNDQVLRHRIAGPDAQSLCAALIQWQLVSRLDHAAYLGRELAKAELALTRGLPYRQDEDLPKE